MSPSRESQPVTAVLPNANRCTRFPAEAIAIQTPLSVVADLFARSISNGSSQPQQDSNASEDFYAGVRDYFSSILADHVDAVSISDLFRKSARNASFGWTGIGRC